MQVQHTMLRLVILVGVYLFGFHVYSLPAYGQRCQPGSELVRREEDDRTIRFYCKCLPDHALIGGRCVQQNQASPPGTVDPKRVATPEACSRNLAYRSRLDDRVKKLEGVAWEQRLRRLGIGSLHDEELFMRSRIMWDALEGLTESALGPILDAQLDAAKAAGNLTRLQVHEIMAVRDAFAAALASGRPGRSPAQETDKSIDAGGKFKSILMRSGLSRIMDDKAADALIRVVDIQLAVLKGGFHQKDPRLSRDAQRQIEDAVALAAVAYKPAAVAKGLVSIGGAAWYYAATRGNLDMIKAAFAKALQAELILQGRLDELRARLKVYDKDLALCGGGG